MIWKARRQAKTRWMRKEICNEAHHATSDSHHLGVHLLPLAAAGSGDFGRARKTCRQRAEPRPASPPGDAGARLGGPGSRPMVFAGALVASFARPQRRGGLA